MNNIELSLEIKCTKEMIGLVHCINKTNYEIINKGEKQQMFVWISCWNKEAQSPKRNNTSIAKAHCYIPQQEQ